MQAKGGVQFQGAEWSAERSDGDGPAQSGVVGVADRRRKRKTVETASADDHHQFAAAGPGIGHGASAQQLHRQAKTDPQGLAAGEGGHRRWNSGLISRMARPSDRVSARAMVLAASGERRAPRAFCAVTTGSF